DRLVPSGTRAPLEPGSVTDLIQRTGRPTHIDDYRTVSGELAGKAQARGLRCGVGAPIVVDGKLWGAIVALFPDPLPWPSVERRLSEFTELVGTAISNAQARSEVARLAEEQAALRRVATLIARGAPPEEVFPAVAREVAQLLGDATPNIMRYEAEGEVTFLVGDTTLAAGTRTRLAGDSVTERIRRTGAPAYVENYRNLWGTAADIARERSLRCGVGAPIVVDGKLWGAMLALFPDPLPSPSAAQRRISEFTELVATALSNAHARAELAASRARIVAAADQARRRIERDLHDGTQQRLVTLTLRLRAAEQSLSSHQKELRKELADVAGGLADALEELRELARGIHPAILSEAGLAPALKALARRSAIPIELELGVEGRLPAPVEIASYYAVSEGLANAAKHARASVVHVRAELLGGELRVTIQDDGVGGAEPSRGSGLLGLTDRMAALGGVLAVLSPAGEGTTLHLKLPVAD
ncbi:MAG TPA: GAF domain-containing protein, partial [Actinomycetota bacterium]